MNSFWNNLYDSVKDRRYGLLFFGMFFASIGMIFGLLAFFEMPNLQGYFLGALPGVVILAVALAWRAIRRAQLQRGNKLLREELSRDEIRKARSKLRNETRPMRRAAPRAPDIDLKY